MQFVYKNLISIKIVGSNNTFSVETQYFESLLKGLQETLTFFIFVCKLAQ